MERISQGIASDKEKEQIRKHIAKEHLKYTLDENEENKRRQLEQAKKEKEQDIKSMDEYSKLLEKQEADRAAYFANCASRQNEHMMRMANTVVKEQNDKLKEEEEKNRRYQDDKNRR